MECRSGCGACCIAPSIHQPLPGMPEGKPAGVVCVNLEPSSQRCQLWGQPDYPDICQRFAPEVSICGSDRSEALMLIRLLESATIP
ncbi:MAG: YkgJ family cysteine cluster protein [Pseudomonadota bacterium]